MHIGIMLRSVGEKGGISVYTDNLLDELLPLEQENTYSLLYRFPEDAGRYADFSHVEEVILSSSSKLTWDQIVVPNYARKQDIDLLFHPKLTVPLFTSCETVLVMHGAEQFAVPEVFPWSDRLYFSIANPLYCRAASATIVMTERGARDVVDFMGADEERVHSIHESYKEHCRPMPESEARKRLEEYALPEPLILFVGGLTPLKNFGNLLRAFDRIASDVPHHLVAAGFKRWKYADDLALIDELDLADRVSFLGYVPDEHLPAFYNLADVFVMPSLYEGFGMPVLEAMSCGCPVVTTKTGCSPEVAGDAAVLVDPYDPDEIADGMREVLLDEALRNELVERGFRRADQFSWEKCARRTLDVLNLVGSQRS